MLRHPYSDCTLSLGKVLGRRDHKNLSSDFGALDMQHMSLKDLKDGINKMAGHGLSEGMVWDCVLTKRLLQSAVGLVFGPWLFPAQLGNKL